MPTETLRIAFATPEFVTEEHFDGGLANYVNRVSKKLAALGHDVHVVTLSTKNEDEFDHDGVIVHRVMLKPGWSTINRITRYTLSTTLHWLNFSTQTYSKLKQLHSCKPFNLIQYPNYSSCGLFSIPLLRTSHVVRASSYESDWNSASGMKRSVDSTMTEFLERLQYKLTPNVHVPSLRVQRMLVTRRGVINARLIRTPFYIETSDWDPTVYDQFFKDRNMCSILVGSSYTKDFIRSPRLCLSF